MIKFPSKVQRDIPCFHGYTMDMIISSREHPLSLMVVDNSIEDELRDFVWICYKEHQSSFPIDMKDSYTVLFNDGRLFHLYCFHNIIVTYGVNTTDTYNEYHVDLLKQLFQKAIIASFKPSNTFEVNGINTMGVKIILYSYIQANYVDFVHTGNVTSETVFGTPLSKPMYEYLNVFMMKDISGGIYTMKEILEWDQVGPSNPLNMVQRRHGPVGFQPEPTSYTPQFGQSNPLLRRQSEAAEKQSGPQFNFSKFQPQTQPNIPKTLTGPQPKPLNSTMFNTPNPVTPKWSMTSQPTKFTPPKTQLPKVQLPKFKPLKPQPSPTFKIPKTSFQSQVQPQVQPTAPKTSFQLPKTGFQLPKTGFQLPKTGFQLPSRKPFEGSAKESTHAPFKSFSKKEPQQSLWDRSKSDNPWAGILPEKNSHTYPRNVYQ